MLKNLSIKRENYSPLSYAACLVGLFFLFFTGAQGEPFALPILFACLMAEMNPFLMAGAYALFGLIGFSLTKFLITLGQAVLLAALFALYKRFHRVPALEGYVYAFLAIGLWILFGEGESYAFFAGIPLMLQRTIVGILLLGACFFFTFSLSTVIQKTFRCRLNTEELLSSALCILLIGVGFYRALGSTVATGILLFLLLILQFCLKSGSIFPVALLLGLPEAILTHSAEACSALLLYACASMLFSRSGRITECIGVFLTYALFEFSTGLYGARPAVMVGVLIAGFLPCVLFLLIPDFILEHLEEKLVFYRERKLSRIAINRNRVITGEKLFEISGIFREIEVAFDCISKSGNEEKARLSIRTDLISAVCASCPDRMRCHIPTTQTGLDKLIAIGCAKGKANFIDLPGELSGECSNPGGLLFALNRHITDYKNYMMETENANAGRKLLSEQAKGVSEILKTMAMEQSEPFEIYSEKEREISLALARNGILCTEILVYGENDNMTVNLITFGNADGKQIASLIGRVLKIPFMPSEKMPLGDDKYCCSFRKKPAFDAAFGVATLTKEGETACGDTYSIIKIDEKTFLVALSDGMGSGSYARKLSDSTISLIEGFYRTKMPAETILETVNRLLTFNREEGFVCLDIAAVNLESGEAEIIKIGSPMGFIINRESLRLLSGETLPLGLLEGMHPLTARTTLVKDDILVFLSDGVTAAFGSDADLVSFLQTLSPLNPQGLADTLVEEAKKLYGGKAADDMTAIAVRLYAA